MNNKLSCNPVRRQRPSNRRLLLTVLPLLLCLVNFAPYARAGDAPAWMHALVNMPLPAHDEKTDAILLYSEEAVTVVSADKLKEHVRVAYKILRPAGREYGVAGVPFNSRKKVTSLHGWCIPEQGKGYEVNEKDAAEVYPRGIENSELMTDVKVKVLQIPAPDPGNIVGYEYEAEEQPLVLQQSWDFQLSIPARESHFSLSLPAGWEFRALWLNYSYVQPSQAGNNQWQWTVSDVKAIRREAEMPPMRGVAGQMIVSYFPPGGPGANGFANWQQMGSWYLNLTKGRRDASPEIKQEIMTLTASSANLLDKMRAVARFVQDEVRYVAIELGIGGWQPHAASEVFAHRYGDCKDKATLMASMLNEVGVESFYVVINAQRGAVTAEMPAHVGGFNHAILAIKLPADVSDPSLVAVRQDPKYGRLLFFDPTNPLTPFGQIGGSLQENYGLLVTPDGGELIKLPEQPPTTNSIHRTAKLALDSTGTLKGDVQEVRIGDRARSERQAVLSATKESDRIKPIEVLLANSLPTFHITKATVTNLHHSDLPFGFSYSFEAPNYTKSAGDMLLVRPRVIGTKAVELFETNEPRKFPVEFPGPAQDTDTFEITLPAGYGVDELPEPVNADFSFASYHSKTEVNGTVVRYSRTYEVKELSVPASKAEELKKFNRIIATDERSMVILRPASK